MPAPADRGAVAQSAARVDQTPPRVARNRSWRHLGTLQLFGAALALGIVVGLAGHLLAASLSNERASPGVGIVPWYRIELSALRGRRQVWRVPFVNSGSRAVALVAPRLVGCAACLSVDWAGSGAGAPLRLAPGERAELEFTYSGQVELEPGHHRVEFEVDEAPQTPHGVTPGRSSARPRSAGRGAPLTDAPDRRSGLVATEVHLQLTGDVPTLLPSPARVRAGGRETARWVVRGDFAWSPEALLAHDGEASVVVLWVPAGWRSPSPLVEVIPATPWSGLQAGTLQFRMDCAEAPQTLPWRVAAIDPFRAHLEKRVDGSATVVVEAFSDCEVRVATERADAERHGPSAVPCLQRLAARDRLTVQLPAAFSPGVVRVADRHGTFVCELPRRP